MRWNRYIPFVLVATLVLSALCVTSYAGSKPEITSHTVQTVDRALSVNVQWQSENPVTSVKIIAGRSEKEIKIDEYDNRRNPSGYYGEASAVIQLEQVPYPYTIPYQIQLVDDLRQKSELLSGQTTLQAVAAAPGMVPPMGVAPQAMMPMPGMMPPQGAVMMPGGAGMPAGQQDDGWGKSNIRAGKAQGNEPGSDKSNNMIDKMLKVAERFDLPPSLDVIRVNVLGPTNVSFSSRANDAKGLRDITFRVYDGVGNKVGEQVLTNLGKKWDGSTDSIAVTGNAPFRVTAQASNIGGSTSKEQIATFSMTSAGRTYKINKDFEEGQLVGLEDQTVKDQLQLSNTSSALPFIWVPNSGEGTISKIDSRTGTEIGRYFTGPNGGGNPSRTTVDLKGNCWVGNRNTGTVVKIGLSENGQCIDRNGNGKIDTSTSSTALPWGQDECVLSEVVLNKNNEATLTPGTAGGAYNDSGPRGIAIDKNNNVWAGTYGSHMFYYIDGSSGAILKKIDTGSHGSYGMLIDQNGLVWSAGVFNGNVMRLDPATNAMSAVALGHVVYGIGLDKAGNLFATGWTDNVVSKISTSTGQVVWKSPGESGIRGIAATDDGDIWTANSYSNTVTRWDTSGKSKASIPGMNHPTGVAVDADGYVWVTNYNDNNVLRINPSTNAVDLKKPIGGSGHYGYSDMSGIVARSMTSKLGTWTVVADGKSDSAGWGTVSWNGTENANATIKVRARVSNNMQTWSNWEDITKGVALKSAVAGRYIQIETSLQLISGNISPVLKSLTVTGK